MRLNLAGAEHEVDGAEQAEAGPEVVQGGLFLQIDHREGDEDRESDDLLQDLQLSDRAMPQLTSAATTQCLLGSSQEVIAAAQ